MPEILRSSQPSPFGRKVKIALAVLGLEDRFTIEKTDTMDPADSLRQQNPLGKIPVIVRADGTSIYDSRVILEYLDLLAGGNKIIPADAEARVKALTEQSLADGIMDAGLLLRYEALFRAEDRRDAKWLTHQSDKVTRGLAHLELHTPALDAPVTVGTIALACALGYQDFRFEGTWRRSHSRLVAWFDAYAPKLKGWDKTKPPM